ncbi:nose resistant to fluoxetine protein 6 [Caerostris extrusa]|uniref:Nose resistant to fluoxetine protein 6 n=1 Tax=Caerostris extrusa TaxID=172846 RepID=A0AAV4VWM5_CAEEX|nr:nose resistant to fluoxetine protein 6 [Caerostris extrusa]
MIVVAFFTTLNTYTNNGPLWPDYDVDANCKVSWWWNLLYINNFQTSEKQEFCWHIICTKRKQNNSPKLNLIILSVGWIVASSVSLACVFGLYNHELTRRSLLLQQFKSHLLRFWVSMGYFCMRHWPRRCC